MPPIGKIKKECICQNKQNDYYERTIEGDSDRRVWVTVRVSLGIVVDTLTIIRVAFSIVQVKVKNCCCKRTVRLTVITSKSSIISASALVNPATIASAVAFGRPESRIVRGVTDYFCYRFTIFVIDEFWVISSYLFAEHSIAEIYYSLIKWSEGACFSCIVPQYSHFSPP